MLRLIKSFDAAFSDFSDAQLRFEIGDSARGQALHDLTVRNVEVADIDRVEVAKDWFVIKHCILPGQSGRSIIGVSRSRCNSRTTETAQTAQGA